VASQAEASSVTRRFVKKCAQFCWNIAQNGALVYKNFFTKKFLVKICEFEDKKQPKFRAYIFRWILGNIFEKKFAQMIWAIFFRQKCAQRQKISPKWSHWKRPKLLLLRLHKFMCGDKFAFWAESTKIVKPLFRLN
jgi:hypothetical protein